MGNVSLGLLHPEKVLGKVDFFCGLAAPQVILAALAARLTHVTLRIVVRLFFFSLPASPF